MDDTGNNPPAPEPAPNGDGNVLPFPGGGNGGRPPAKPRVHKIRVALVVLGLAVIAFVSTIFGMMMAVASDLPALENRQEYKSAKNSILYDIHNKPLGVLTNSENRILVTADQISPMMSHAIIAIEDRRFYEHDGVDYQGIGRAFIEDILSQGAVQGGSTIPQQFVKNALAAQSKRTVFQKLREAALAYHLSRKWSKRKILTEYLNSVYFANGAYGVESAARVYFANRHPGCDNDPVRPCASQLTAAESATLAGIVASPYSYDPIANPRDSRNRRNLVLRNMLDQGYLTQPAYDAALREPMPTRFELQPPREISDAPYFTTWVKQQVVDRFGAQRAFGGGLKIQTTLDLDLQKAAQQAVENHLTDPKGPQAAMVVIDNATGEVRAMVGGRDYGQTPFNLATQGQRQPGSSFKAFVLAAALKSGISPDSVWESKQKFFKVPHSADPNERFVVNNYEGQYSGSQSLAGATAVSDNSVFAEVGIKVGTTKIARIAKKMGIRTPISTNISMTLGGLKEGVTPLDMAHAYETVADGGERTWGTLGAQKEGPVGIHEVRTGPGIGETVVKRNEVRKDRVLKKDVADQMTSMLEGVVLNGTGTEAQIGDFAAGKTGTTENYGDAWFVGFTKTYTAAVWVGYPDSLRPMKTEFNGGPVAGGTFPAEIWHDFMVSAKEIDAQRKAEREARAAAKRGEIVSPDQFLNQDSSSGDTGSGDTSGGGDTSGSTGTDTGAGATGGDTGGGSTGGGDTGGGSTGGGDTGGGGGGSSSGGESGGVAPPG